MKRILDRLRVTGYGSFSEEQMVDFIKLRATLPLNVSKAFGTCQFQTVGGRVRVKPSDFAEAAKLDPKAPWAKAAARRLSPCRLRS